MRGLIFVVYPIAHPARLALARICNAMKVILYIYIYIYIYVHKERERASEREREREKEREKERGLTTPEAHDDAQVHGKRRHGVVHT